MILSVIVFFMAVVIHEFAHGWTAYKLGDPTAKYAGRLTLNPLVHIDPFGTILLPLMLIVMKAPIIFGWAKPVPINFWNLKHRRRDMALVGLAGPLSNLILAFLASLIVRWGGVNLLILQLVILLNLALAVFNLIPIPPLDGSRILMGLLPKNFIRLFVSLEQYGFIILLILLWLGVFNYIIWPVVAVLARLLGV